MFQIDTALEKASKSSIDSHRSLLVTSPRSFLGSASSMATRLDRLEKFFSRKKSITFRDSLFGNSRAATPVSPSNEVEFFSQAFPAPSFIRPTASRMSARDEPPSNQPTRRAHSLPEATSLQSREPPKPAGLSQSPKVPKRSSSLLHRRTSSSIASSSIAGLLEFSFPENSARSPDAISSLHSPRASTTASPSPMSSPTRKKHTSRSPEDLLLAFPSHRPDTPPQSDQEDCSPTSTPAFARPPPPPPPLPVTPPQGAGGPTPDSSPKLLPLLEERSAWYLRGNKSSPSPQPRKYRSLESPEKPLVDMTSLRKASSHAALSKGVSADSPTLGKSPILKEPTLTEFLSLSDDDVADGRPILTSPSKPPNFALPPNPPAPHIRAQESKAYPLLTLSSPMASRPATAAAFEVARIAARYNFDLVYVVNLWPNNLLDTLRRSSGSGSDSASASRPDSPDSPSDTQSPCSPPAASRPGLTGRLLAAYGLPAVTSPFRISAPVHQKVLRTDGWLEYRSEDLAPGEFSGGYSCSFYTDNDVNGRPRTTTTTTTTTTSSGRNSTTSTPTPTTAAAAAADRKNSLRYNNRGIVFAAYRLPRPDGTTISSSLGELNALYQDAETLVEMLVDIHSMQRSRYPRGKYDSEETGPMPVRDESS